MNEMSFKKPGLVRKFTAGADRTNGEVLEIAGFPGFMLDDKSNGDTDCEQQIRCVGDARKVTGAVTVGQTVYWDNDGDPVTGTAGTGAATTTASDGDFVLGVCVVAAASGDDYVRVSLAWESEQLVKTFGAKGGAVSQGFLGGAGTTASKSTATAAGNFLEFRLDGSAGSGTYRGIYMRLHVTGGAGGESVRAYTFCEDNTPADTVNGAHISLDFGASVGNITGLGTASRNTFHVPNRSLGGTTAAVMAEFWAAGTASANGGTMSFLRCVLGGNATGYAAIEDTVNFAELAGGTTASGNVFAAKTSSAVSHGLRCKFHGVTYYIMVSDTQ